ncbi:sigma-70 family RNA polymerase sigma factor [Saccharomonospora cyanea]|uniref:RNA polymerase sigma factor n=1 Tax=Saccharomonospora cyanea NA-134 TaxID=882082 RepID=H5XRD8_9PSEU|nr:sigma-70 family RNA polymerase sigma factor [Saccharomonospora cyanea]EHR63420.1 RNA polymerase sigma-70 factor, TIGR02960 family [Saccharomonospora cyanea NA-134]
MRTDTAADPGFTQQVAPYRRELLAHCYRMLGSPHEAEDVLQETLVRAWRGYDGFEHRSSLRTWLYRVATTTCLNALKGMRRRPTPCGVDGTSSDPADDLVNGAEVPWLQPMPDALVELPDDPAAVITSRESIRLAFVAALQHLPPRQRAVLLLRDVLAWSAAEVADALGTTAAAVNSLLQRARTTLEGLALRSDAVTEPTEAQQRELLERYVAAFERKDIPRLVELFTADVVWEMPPYVSWYQGAEAVGAHLDKRCPGRPGGILMVPVAANGRPGFAQYLRDEKGGGYGAFLVQVLEPSADGIRHVVNYLDTGVFDLFGLPRWVAQSDSSGMRSA